MKELLKQFGLSDEQIDKIMEKHDKAVNTVQTKLDKEAEKVKTFNIEKTANENKVKDLEEKLENIVDTLGIELDDNVDISNAFDNYVKEALKNAGGEVTSKELKDLQRELVKAQKDFKKVQAELDTAKNTLVEEKGKRHNQIIRNEVIKALQDNNVIKADKMVALFLDQAKYDEENGSVLYGETDLVDAVKEWATENPELVKAPVIGGSGGGSGSGGTGETPDIIKSILASKKSTAENTVNHNDFFK